MTRFIRSLTLAGLCLSFTPSLSFAARSMPNTQQEMTSHFWKWSAPTKIASAQDVMSYVTQRLDVYQTELHLKNFSYQMTPGDSNNFTLEIKSNLPHTTLEQALIQSWPAVIEGQKGNVFPQSAKVMKFAQILPQECTPRDTEKRFIEMTTTDDGAIKLANITAEIRGQKLAIYLGQEQIMAPRIQEAIVGGKAKIELSNAQEASEKYQAMQKKPQELGFYQQHPVTFQWIPVNLNGRDLQKINLAGAEEEGPPHCLSYSLTFPITKNMREWLKDNSKASPIQLFVGDKLYGPLNLNNNHWVLKAALSETEVKSLRVQAFSPGFSKAMSFLSYSHSHK